MAYFQRPDLKAVYDQPYSARDMAWRQLCAAEKARNIRAILGPMMDRCQTILEVGCGTGDVLAELAMAYPDKTFHGVEISSERGQLDARFAGLANIRVGSYDGYNLPFDNNSFDLVYASHVLEHVLDERGFLKQLRRVARDRVVVEVPCELTFLQSRARLQSTFNIGHINCYTVDSFLLTLETAGLVVDRHQIHDHSPAVHRFHSGAMGPLKWLLRSGLLAAAPGLAPKLFAYHTTALCQSGPVLSFDTETKR